MALIFTPDGLLGGGRYIAIDQPGNVWIVNTSTDGIVELSRTGVELSPTGGYPLGGAPSSPYYVQFDDSDHLWVTDFLANTVRAIDTAGNVTVSPFGGSSTFRNPSGLAFDSFGQVWVANSGNGSAPPHDLTVSTTSGVFSFFVDRSGMIPVEITADTTQGGRGLQSSQRAGLRE